jgi:hypothetical protein
MTIDPFPNFIKILHDLNNWEMWIYFKRKEADRMACACHVCKRTGIRECDPEAAEIKCMLCGFCETERQRKEREAILQ